jgi:hypothetical protein
MFVSESRQLEHNLFVFWALRKKLENRSFGGDFEIQ